MDIRKWLFSNMFFRNMIADLFGRANTRKPGGFTPYFQYKIGSYHSDYYLYFPNEPFSIQYKNEIFNKLNEYDDADIADYLEFHFLAYPEKQGFLRFLRYELYGRLNRKTSATRRQKLQIVQQWVSEKQQEIQATQQEVLQKEIEQDVREILPAGRQASAKEVEDMTQALTKN
jgi:hypothetical protein